MPPIPRRFRGLLPALAVAIAAFVRFIILPNRTVIGRFVLPDQGLFFLPFQKVRLSAVIRTGGIPIRAAHTRPLAVTSYGCDHKSSNKGGARPDLNRPCVEGESEKKPSTSTRRAVLPPEHGKPEGGLCLLSAQVLVRRKRNTMARRRVPAGGAYRIRTGDTCLEGRCVTTAPMLHIASLSRLSPPAWLAFAVSFRTSTLALEGVAGPLKAVHISGALS